MDNEYLNFIFQNAQMGVIGISQLQGKVKEDPFKKLLVDQSSQYSSFAARATELLAKNGEVPQEIGVAARAGSKLSTEVNTAMDGTTSHLAEMMIEGTNIGIVKLIQKSKTYPEAAQEVKDLSSQLIAAEEGNVQSLKAYL